MSKEVKEATPQTGPLSPEALAQIAAAVAQTMQAVQPNQGAALPPNFAEQLAEGIRKANIDPELEARKQKHRERLRMQREESELEIAARQSACTHLRQDNSSAIAWYTFADNITRGVCQHCDKRFNPMNPDGTRNEEYFTMIRVSTNLAVNI